MGKKQEEAPLPVRVYRIIIAEEVNAEELIDVRDLQKKQGIEPNNYPWLMKQATYFAERGWPIETATFLSLIPEDSGPPLYARAAVLSKTYKGDANFWSGGSPEAELNRSRDLNNASRLESAFGLTQESS